MNDIKFDILIATNRIVNNYLWMFVIWTGNLMLISIGNSLDSFWIQVIFQRIAIFFCSIKNLICLWNYFQKSAKMAEKAVWRSV